jgi:hypothetical protein
MTFERERHGSTPRNPVAHLRVVPFSSRGSIAGNRIRAVEEFDTHEFPIEEIADAFAAVRAGEVSKCLLRYTGTS